MIKNVRLYWRYLILLSACWFTLSPTLRAESLVIVDAVSLLQPQAQPTNESLLLRQLLQAYPADYSIVDVSRNRAREWVKTADNACMPWLKKTAARQQDFLFTLPYMIEAALQLVVAADSDALPLLDRLSGNNNTLSLTHLLQLKQAPLLGIELNRTYGNNIDSLVSQRYASWSIYTRTSSSNETGSMLPMLERGFIDATLEYRKVAERSAMSFRYYAIQEAEPFNLVYFACSKGERGQRVVNLLNESIKLKSQQVAYQQLVLQSIAEKNHDQALQTWLQTLKLASEVEQHK